MMYDNLYLYVADALRYDSIPYDLLKWGKPAKCIASGIRTPESLATILTGQYPCRHGVHGFRTLPDSSLPSLFDLTNGPSLAYRFPQAYQHTEDIEYMADHREWIDALTDVSDRFVAIDRDLYAHAPYRQEIGDEEGYSSAEEYWKTVADEYALVRRDYRASAETVFERFQRKLSVLESRGILDETLVIFTADHGELFGEYGLVGHGVITVPELVYVPLVFPDDIQCSVPDMTAHIDFLPTVNSLLDGEIAYEGPGYDLTTNPPDDRIVLCEHPINGGTWSAWDIDGGHVFDERSLTQKVRWYLRTMLTTQNAVHNRKHPIKVARVGFAGSRTFGEPLFSRRRAREEYDHARSNASDSRGRSVDLDSDAIEQLEALGYRDDLRREDIK